MIAERKQLMSQEKCKLIGCRVDKLEMNQHVKYAVSMTFPQ